ncbi:MAG: hypothetical protein ABIG39_06380 [Candidatus Micrarchaeota archaeon]
MGFGTSVTQAIFFIAAAIVALGLVGVMTAAAGSVANAFNQKADTLSDQIKTDITIISDPCYIGGYSYVYIKNTGDSYLDANTTAIFVDSTYVSVAAIDILNGTWVLYSDVGIWGPYDVVRFNTTSSFSTGYHTLRVVAENGVYDSIYYSDC